MKSITQKHAFGCGAACVAFATNKTYEEVVQALGEDKASKQGFYCKELVRALKNYEYKYIKPHILPYLEKPGTIVFMKRGKIYPAGHYVVRTEKGWMDPWINFAENQDISEAKSGFRKELPEKPIYAVFPKQNGIRKTSLSTGLNL